MASAADVFNLLGQGFDFLSKPFTLGYQIYQDQRDYNQQKRQFGSTMDFARESRDLMMQREDDLMQRRVADMEAAGLHKTLATGMSPSPGMPGTPAMGRAGGEQVQQPGSPLESALISKQARAMDLANERTLAETERIRAETNRIRRENRTGEIYASYDEQAAAEKFWQLYNEGSLQRLTIAETENRITIQALEMRERELRMKSEEIRQVSMMLGITDQQLMNEIKRHDTEIIRDSRYRSDDRSRQAQTEAWINARTTNPQARSILSTIMSAGDYILDSATQVLRALR